MDTSLPKEFMLLLFIFAILSKNLAQSVYENHNTSESYFGMRQFRGNLNYLLYFYQSKICLSKVQLMIDQIIN